MNTSIHAHIDSDHRDCDGLYEARYITRPAEGQSREDFLADLDEFYVYEGGREEAGIDEDGRYGWESHEATEEGYRSVWVILCTDKCDDDGGIRFDRSAESAGY